MQGLPNDPSVVMWINLLNKIRQIVSAGYESCDRTLRANHGLDSILAGNTNFAIAPAARLTRKALRKMTDGGMRIPIALCDRNQALWGTAICGVQVMSYEDFAAKWPDSSMWVASALHDSAIREFLAERGFRYVVPYPYIAHVFPDVFATREYAGLTESVFAVSAISKIEKLCELLADDRSREVLLSKVLFYLTYDKSLLDRVRSRDTIYWDSTVMRLRRNEVIVDGGAYRGDTLEDFLIASHGVFRRYYAFEPDPLVQQSLRTVAGCDPLRIECVECGLSEKRNRIAFSVSGTADTSVAGQSPEASGDVTYLNVTDLDSFFAGKEPPTFIKMDIEGEERRAIAGAEFLIEKYRPTLAVSVYHHPHDLWEIPLLIAERTTNARIFLRHYTREVDDTVCYAVPMRL